MAGPNNKKRSMHGKSKVPYKKFKKQQEYHSGSEDEDEEQTQDFDAINLLDSDDDVLDAKAEDVGADDDNGGNDSDSGSEEETELTEKSKPIVSKGKMSVKMSKKPSNADDKAEADDVMQGYDTEDSVEDDEFDLGDDGEKAKPKKRNDPAAFATSLSRILSTKLSSSKRSDPVLSRSSEAHQASKAAIDSALEAKAKRQLREQKKLALERGRVRDVLIATSSETPGAIDMTTSDILEIERRLRKVAQRGVVKMFNAVRAAQVKSAEAERSTKKAGVIGMARRDEKVNEMSKKGFLDLIASGGGGLKKGPLEEA